MVSSRDLIEMADYIKADEIVVPDVLGDCDGTINLARDFQRRAEVHPEFRYMGVLQGRNLAEILKCFNGLRFLDYITIFGLPRIMGQISKTERYIFAEHIGNHFDDTSYEFHCLGTAMWVREVVLLAECMSVRGIDTAAPIKMALDGIELRTARKYEVQAHRDGYFEATPDQTTIDLVHENIDTYMSWAGM